MTTLTPSHVAFLVDDLAAARAFCGFVVGCPEGRDAETWIDFDLFGHQIVAHYKAPSPKASDLHRNPVDGFDVPAPHFGVVLEMGQRETLAERLKAAGVKFVIEPYIRFKGQICEQATMFFCDPVGNAFEFKTFADKSKLFAK